MREIKFRAWDKVEKKMLVTVESWNKVWWDDISPENEYDYHLKCLYVDNQGHVLEHTDEHGICDMNYLLQGKPKYDLMQYTGLLDKWGQQIFEGDIVYIHDNYLDGHCPDHLGIIKTHPNYPHKLAVWGKIGQVLHGKGEQYLESSTAYLEVIGNIYENTKLLEVVSHD